MGKDTSGPDWGEGFQKPSGEGGRGFEEMIYKEGGGKPLPWWSRAWVTF